MLVLHYKYFCLMILIFCILGSCVRYRYQSTIESSHYTDDTIREILINVESNQRNARYFAALGRNVYSYPLNIILAISALLTGIIAVIEGSKL